MRLLWEDRAWEDYLYWQMQDKKTLKRINALIKDIARNAFDGIFDSLDALGIGGTGAGHPQDLAACCLTPLGLGHVALNILHRNIQHGLHGNGILAADGHIADLHFTFQLPHGLLPFVKSPR